MLFVFSENLTQSLTEFIIYLSSKVLVFMSLRYKFAVEMMLSKQRQWVIEVAKDIIQLKKLCVQQSPYITFQIDLINLSNTYEMIPLYA